MPNCNRKNRVIAAIISMGLICILSSCIATNTKKTFRNLNCNDTNANIKPIDCYHLKIGKILKKNWEYSYQISELDEKLEAIVIIKILSDGSIRDFMFESKSGNTLLDDSVKNAVLKSDPFPKLPEGKTSYSLGLIFTPKGLK